MGAPERSKKRVEDPKFGNPVYCTAEREREIEKYGFPVELSHPRCKPEVPDSPDHLITLGRTPPLVLLSES